MYQPITFETAYFHGLHQLPLRAPMVSLHIDCSGVGPCEKLFRSMPPAPIRDLDVETVYAIAVAFDRLGLELDRNGVSADEAFSIYAELTEAVDAHMQRYRLGDCGPFSAKLLAEAFSDVCMQRFDGVTSDLTQTILWDVARVLDSQAELQALFDTMLQRRSTAKQPLYSDPSIRDACTELFGNVQTFHIASNIYDQCERSNWDIVRVRGGLLPADAFTIAVDGETWPPLEDDPTRQVQTEWLICDNRKPLCYLYERVKLRGIEVVPGTVQVAGVSLDTKTGESRSIESSSIYVPHSGSYRGWEMGSVQVGRLVRVALTFMIILQNKSVRVSEHEVPGHWNVGLPPERNVDDVVDEVLRGGLRRAVGEAE